MKALIVSGSRDRSGHTARAIEAICRGIARAGGSSESIFLPEMELHLCRQCDNDGWGLCSKKQKCIIKDDFSKIMTKIHKADAIVFATPVYSGDLSETMRCFLDRCSRVSHPPAPGGLSPTKAIISGKQNAPREGDPEPGSGTMLKIPTLGLCVAGGGGIGAPACLARLDTAIQRSFIFDVVDMIPIRRQNLDYKIPMLENTGEWLITQTKS